MLTIVLLALLALPLAVASSVMMRRALILALPYLIVLNGVPLRIGSSPVRVDQLAALSLTAALLSAVLWGQRRLVLDRGAGWLLAFIGVNIVSSVLYSPARAYSLVQVANQASAWIIYIVVLNYAGDGLEPARRMLKHALIATAIVCAAGVLAFLIGKAGFDVGGANPQEIVGGVAVPLGSYASMREPNIFGSFSAAMLVLSIGIAFASGTTRVLVLSPGTLRVVAASAGAGLLFSFTRGAWLGAAWGFAVLAFLAARVMTIRFRPWKLVAPVLLTLAAGVVLWFSPFEAAEFFRYKVRNLVNPQSANAGVRLLAFAMALEQYVESPLLGRGTFSFAPLVADGIDFRSLDGWQNLWIPNFLILVLHDTGIIGLGIFLALLGTIVRSGVRAARKLTQSRTDVAAVCISLVAAFMTLWLPFLFSTGFSLGYPWMIAGLAAAYARIAAEAPLSAPALPFPTLRAADEDKAPLIIP